MAGNRPTADAILWSALSLIPSWRARRRALCLRQIRFSRAGKAGASISIRSFSPVRHRHSQRATIKYFAVAALLFFAQVMVGGATAHYRADPGSFYGIDFSRYLSEQRAPHLAPAARHLLDRDRLRRRRAVSCRRPWEARSRAGRRWGSTCSSGPSCSSSSAASAARCSVSTRCLGNLWFWFGHQGWEYLDLGTGLAAPAGSRPAFLACAGFPGGGRPR